jgi:CheY-like chemotaxis protein
MKLKPHYIVLADDDIDDCNFFKKALEELKLSTDLTIVHDGEQLMDYLAINSEFLPDVIFLDLNMPRKNGFECLIEIKASEHLKHIFVVIFSTTYPGNKHYEQDLINTLLNIGALYYIIKPDNFQKLKTAIHQALIMVAEKASFDGQAENSILIQTNLP